MNSLFYNIKQRSKEWYNTASQSIGGSSAGALIDQHYNYTKNDMIDRLINGPPVHNNSNNFAMVHGCIMEALHKEIMERGMACKIYDQGIHKSSKWSHFSPDGTGISLTGEIFLVEYKTPYFRQIKNNRRQIPNQYENQMQYSMMQINFNYCMYQEINIIYTDDPENAYNNSNRVQTFVPFGTFRMHLMAPNLPLDKVHLLSDIPSEYAPYLLSGAEVVSRPIVEYTMLGNDYVQKIFRLAYGDMIQFVHFQPEIDTSQKYNLVLAGCFGPAACYKIEPDRIIMDRLKSGLEDVVYTANNMKI